LRNESPAPLGTSRWGSVETGGERSGHGTWVWFRRRSVRRS